MYADREGSPFCRLSGFRIRSGSACRLLDNLYDADAVFLGDRPKPVGLFWRSDLVAKVGKSVIFRALFAGDALGLESRG